MKSCDCGGQCGCDDKPKNYMFFGNLQIIQRAIEALMQMDPDEVDEILEEHAWAVDHIATSADDIQEVANFFLNKDEMMDEMPNKMSNGKNHLRMTMMDDITMYKMPSIMDHDRVVKTFENFLFEKKNQKLKSKKKKDQDMDGDSDFADARIAQYMAGGMSRQEAIRLSRKFNKK
jgi:hypothetical protein